MAVCNCPSITEWFDRSHDCYVLWLIHSPGSAIQSQTRCEYYQL